MQISTENWACKSVQRTEHANQFRELRMQISTEDWAVNYSCSLLCSMTICFDCLENLVLGDTWVPMLGIHLSTSCYCAVVLVALKLTIWVPVLVIWAKLDEHNKIYFMTMSWTSWDCDLTYRSLTGILSYSSKTPVKLHKIKYWILFFFGGWCFSFCAFLLLSMLSYLIAK